MSNGEGRGGAIFICTAEEGGDECSAKVINNCSTFTDNSADDAEHDTFGQLVGNGNSCDKPLLVTLSDFQVNGTTLSWTTASELDNAGFNVSRRVSGGFWEPINDTPIPANGEASTYTFTDSSADSDQNYDYRLENIDMSGYVSVYYPEGAAPVIRLISPANEAMLSSATVPVFQWHATDYKGFIFEYAYQGSGIKTLADTWNSATSFTPPADSWTDFANQLDDEETVSWRIKGQFGGAEANYSDVYQFTIK